MGSNVLCGGCGEDGGEEVMVVDVKESNVSRRVRSVSEVHGVM